MTGDRRIVRPSEPQAAAARAEPGERLFEFSKGADQFVCELRDQGEFGIEAQFLLNGELYIAQTFREQPAIDRMFAIAWAEHQRATMERR